MADAIDAGRWARIRTLFHGALERSADERAGWLARACGDDPAIHAEVARLLAAHDAAGTFLEPPPAVLTGHRIGRYDVGRLLGSGGMGDVYLARDVELGRDIALKIARTPDGDSRLRREAQHASRLNHPHICTIHEAGVFDGRVYVAMEHVEGTSLSGLIPAGGLAADDVGRLGAQIASALSHAHEQGLVHGDLKTANVVITPDGRAKVLDFGLARRLPPERVKNLTQSGAPGTGGLEGTLSCMAPELLRGEPAGVASDIWALGVLLHEMASGSRPFTGATGFELSAAILHTPPAPLPSSAPPRLQAIVGRCLDKDPALRYQRASDAQSALASLRARGGGRVPRLAAAAALVLLLVGAAGGGIAWRLWSAPEAPVARGAAGRPALAVMAFENLAGEDAAWLSTGVQSMLLTGLAQTQGLDLVSTQRLHEVARATGREALESLSRSEASEIARRAGAGAVVVGSVARIGTAIRIDAQVEDLSSGRVLAAGSATGTDLFGLADQLAARIRDGIGLDTSGAARPLAEVSTTSLEAYRLYAEGVDAFVNLRLDDARLLLEQAVALDPQFAEAYLQLALTSGPAGRPGDRGVYLRRAAEHSDRLSERRRLLMDVELARDQGRFADAARGLTLLRTRFPDLDAISTLAVQLHVPVIGPLPDAMTLLEIARDVVTANPTSTLARNNLAYALLHAGRYDEAIRELETYVRLAPREPNPYDTMGEVYLVAGSVDAAIAAFDRALAIDSGFVTGGRAWALAVAGRYDEALREPRGPAHLSALMLARVGRYREAAQTLAAGTAAARAAGDPMRAGGLQLLAALLAIERKDSAAALAACRAATMLFAPLPDERKRLNLVLVELMTGAAELGMGGPAAARVHLQALERLHRADVPVEKWWHDALEGEIALAAGDLDAAATAFTRGEPSRRSFTSLFAQGSVLVNDLPSRDGLARVARARGDHVGALAIYRRLLAYGPDRPWVALFEPRYVLEIARLLERTGDISAARAEYEQFLQLWQQADAGLPETAEAKRALARLRTSSPARY